MVVEYVYFILDVENINHTQLYNDAREYRDFRETSFKKMFYHKGCEDIKSSREHEEVVIRCCEVFLLDVKFLDKKTRRSDKRYSIIYRKVVCDIGKKEALTICQSFIKKYQKTKSDVEIKVEKSLPSYLSHGNT